MQIMLQSDMLPPKVKDITGQRFGRLTVEEFVGLRGRSDGMRHAVWKCRCDCGASVECAGVSLRGGNTKSCGCLRAIVGREVNLQHGAASEMTGAYRSWRTMLQRCRDPKCNRWKDYGGRGIKVCERWQQFENFLSDMGERPEGGSLDRIDTNGNYEPSNCRWLPRNEQVRNQRKTKFVILNGERMIQADAARALGVLPQTVADWLSGKRKNCPAILQSVTT